MAVAHHHAFCGKEGFGPINESHDDFTPCFQAVVIRTIPPLFMLVFGFMRVASILHIEKSTFKTPYVKLRLAASVLLALLPIAVLIFHLDKDSSYILLREGLVSLSWLCSILLQVVENRRLLAVTWVSRVFWILQWVASGKAVESTVLALYHQQHDSAKIVDVVLMGTQFFFNCIMVLYAVGTRRMDGDHEQHLINATGDYNESRVGDNYSHHRLEDGTDNNTGTSLWNRFLGGKGDPNISGDFGIDYDDSAHVTASIHSPSSTNQQPRAPFNTPSKTTNSPIKRQTSSLRDAAIFDELNTSSASTVVPDTSLSLHDVQLFIPTWTMTVKKTKAGKTDRKVMQFSVKVIVPASDARPVGSFMVWRRFRDFGYLHASLETKASQLSIALPAFPSHLKQGKGEENEEGSSMRTEQQERCRAALEIYVQDLIHEQHYWVDIARFLHYSEHVTELDSQHYATAVLAAQQQGGRDKNGERMEGNTGSGEDDDNDTMISMAGEVSTSFSGGHLIPSVKDDSKHKDSKTSEIIGVHISHWEQWYVTATAPTPSAAGSPAPSPVPRIVTTFAVQVTSTTGSWSLRKQIGEFRSLEEAMKQYLQNSPSIAAVLYASQAGVSGVSEPPTEGVLPTTTLAEQLSINFPKIPSTLDFKQLSSAADAGLKLIATQLEVLLQTLVHLPHSHCEALLAFFDRHASLPSALVRPPPTPPGSPGVLGAGEKKKKQKGVVMPTISQADFITAYNKVSPSPSAASSPASTPVKIPNKHMLSAPEASIFSSAARDEETGDAGSGVLAMYELSYQVGSKPSKHDNYHRFVVKVTKWMHSSSTPSAKSHVVFTVEVREYYSLRDYLEWKFTRRFSEFSKLAAVLKKHFLDVDVPDCPPATLSLGGQQTAEFLADRSRRLEIFLQKLVNIFYFQCDEMLTFFELDNPRRAISFGSVQV